MESKKRKRNRLSGYDYSQNGMYFITIYTHNKQKILSEIVGDGFPVPRLTHSGIVVDEYINFITIKYPCATVEKYVIMPNHFHLMLLLSGDKGTGDPSPTIGTIIGWLKYQITKQINEQNKSPGVRKFQRSFHDRIIRNQQEYEKIWEYVDTNPLKWELDCFYTV